MSRGIGENQLMSLARSLPSLSCYSEMSRLVSVATQRGMGVMLSETHNNIHNYKWLVWGVFENKKNNYYWLVSIKGDEVFSYCTKADTKWPTCFTHQLIHLGDTFGRIANPDTIVPHLRKIEDLHYTNSKEHSGWERSKPHWASIWSKDHPSLFDELPLGKLYRAIDIGAIIPVFRTSDRLIGFNLKSK